MKKQIFRTADQKEFIGLFDGLCMRRHAWQAWGDFVEACAIAVSNSCDKVSSDRNKREERYRQIMAGYEPKEQEIFPQLFGALTEALEQNPEQDIWYTPTLCLSPVWGYRMLWEKIESVQRCATSDPEPETMTDLGTQLTLF